MGRIAISVAAYEALVATLPLGSVAVEAEPNDRGERTVWLEAAMVERLGATRGPGESYSDAILRLVAGREAKWSADMPHDCRHEMIPRHPKLDAQN
jgi:hypothetical protein